MITNRDSFFRDNNLCTVKKALQSIHDMDNLFQFHQLDVTKNGYTSTDIHASPTIKTSDNNNIIHDSIYI